VFGDASAAEQLGQTSLDISSLDVSSNLDSQALPGKLVDHVQHAERFPVIGGIHHKIIAPDVIGVFRPQTDARTVIQP